uniref:Uncharacterized protein n=1 Tax=Brassica oleracea var. oleracea TaxID=109376 RepID=A0A0D3CC83_BRAOL
MLAQVKKLIEANLLFRVKLTFPTLRSSRLRTLINQITPDIKMLFTNHTYAVSNGPLAPSSVNQPVTTLTKPTAFPSLGAHGELGFMRRIMTTEATTTKGLGIGAVWISNEERMKKETSCAMWRRLDGGLSMWNWRGRSKGGFQPHPNG